MIDEKKLIKKQIMELNTISKIYENKPLGRLLNEVADTMFGLFSKLQSEKYCGKWIPCSERLPEEHKSIFAKFKGTDKWDSAMPVNISNDVNVTVVDEKGERATMTAHTIDGKWKLGSYMKLRVIAWQPFPEPYKGDYQES